MGVRVTREQNKELLWSTTCQAPHAWDAEECWQGWLCPKSFATVSDGTPLVCVLRSPTAAHDVSPWYVSWRQIPQAC